MDKYNRILLVVVLLIGSFELGQFADEEADQQNLTSSEEIIAAIEHLAEQARHSDAIEVRKAAGILYITAYSLYRGNVDHFAMHAGRFAVEESIRESVQEAIRRSGGRQPGGIEELLDATRDESEDSPAEADEII